jgi:hypothetical protein
MTFETSSFLFCFYYLSIPPFNSPQKGEKFQVIDIFLLKKTVFSPPLGGDAAKRQRGL